MAAMTPAYRPVISTITGPGARLWGCNTFVLALMVAGAITPVYAADTSDSGNGSGGGYYGQFYNPNQAPASTATVPEQKQAQAQAQSQTQEKELQSARQFYAPDAAGLTYQPGFHGCAAGAGAGYSSGLGGPLTPMPLVPAQARDRYFRYGISVGETYTDNIEQAANGNEKGAWVTQVVPSLQGCANGGRIQASLNYQLQAMYYANESDPIELYNNVSGATNITVLPGHLFLAADTSYENTVIDASEAYADSNVLRSDNRTSAWITNISPYWVQQLDAVGQATLRYRYGRAEYGSSEVPDYTMQGVYFNLSNPRTNTTWSYLLSIASQRVDNDVQPNSATTGVNQNTRDDWRVTHFDSATLRVGYNVNDSFQVFATGGAENDYQPDGSVDRYGSTLWNVGFRWSSIRNSLEASYGHRAFGSTYSVAINHIGLGYTASLSYDTDRTASGLNQLNRGVQGRAGGISRTRPQLPGSIGDRGVYVRKRLTGTISFDATRTRTTLQAYYGSREYLTRSISDRDIYGGSVGVSYQLGVRTQLNSRVGMNHQKTDQEEFREGQAGIGATYQLTDTSQAGLSYSHRWRNGETGTDSYDENRIVARYSKFF